MKEHILPRLILPRSLAAFVATLAVWGLFSLKSFMVAIAISAVIAVFGLSHVYGHSGNRLYPFYEIPDEAAIDVTDGSIEDWQELFEEPSLTSLNFTGFDQDDRVMGYDPSDLDFRIYLGWNGASDRIYVGAICIDDVYIGEDERSFNYTERTGEDHVTLIIDADHDGSPQWDESVAREQWDESVARGDKGEDSGLMDQGTQGYSGVPLRRETSHVGLSVLETWWDENWWGYSPYGEGGGSVGGENPVVWVTEFYVTPFDRLIRREPENSLVSRSGCGDRLSGFECPSAISMSRLLMGRAAIVRAKFT